MGEFEKEINWCRERREVALEDIADFMRGQRQYLNEVDITDKLRTRAESDVELFDRLIAAYETKNG